MRNTATRHHSVRGFTLIELMISIAIVLVLMLGINFVFTTSAKTVGTGLAFSAIGRDIRGARKTFDQDFGAAVASTQMPALIIHSEEIYAFRDKQDRLADYDYNPADTDVNRQKQTATYDVNGIASDGDEIDMGTPAAPNFPGTYNFRRHRLDRFSMFVRNQSADYTRQTGDANTFVSSETSPEAWLCYGMLRLATNSEINYAKPGVGTDATNPNNFYATQWMLGRKLTLLKPAPYTSATTAITNTGAAALSLVYEATASSFAINSTTASGTFNHETTAQGGPYTAADPWLMCESRVDMVNATIAQIRQTLNTSGVTPADADLTTSATNRDIVTYKDVPAVANSLDYLFWAKPFVNKAAFASGANAMSAQTRETALTSPIFLRGCTQFIVEFAGDFYDQGDASGNPEPAGTIDYVVIAPGVTQIKWYGMPRDLNANGNVTDATDVGPITTSLPGNGIWGKAPTAKWTGAFTPEHLAATAGQPDIWAWAPTVSTSGGATNPNNFRPSLIRITLELIDSNGRIQDGQRIQFIYKLP